MTSIDPLSAMIIFLSAARPHGIQSASDAVRLQETSFRAKSRNSYTTVRHAVYDKERQARHYSMLIQGSPSNGTFEWINP